MNDPGPGQRRWDGGTVVLLFVVVLLAVFLAALLQFTGRYDFGLLH